MNPSKTIHPRYALAALTGLNLLNYLDRYVLPAMITPIEKDLGINDKQFGALVTAFMVGYFVTAPFFGYLGDRFPRKYLITAGVLVWSVGTMVSGLAQVFIVLLLIRVLVGFGEASYGTLSPTWIADLYSPAKRNNAISIFYLAIPIGGALGFLLGGWMQAHYGWRWAFLWAGLPGLFLALLVLFLREPARGASEPASDASTKPAPSGIKSYLKLFRFPSYVLVVIGYIGQTFAMGGFSIFAPAFLQRSHHLSLHDADNFFSVSLVVTGFSATLLGGYLGTAWQKRHPAGYARLLALSSVCAVPAAFAAFLVSNTALSQTALVIAMFCLFLSTGPVNTVILETVPVSMRACAMAASIFSIHFFGDLWSPIIIGALSDRWHDLQQAILWTLPIAIVISAIFWIWLAFQMGRRPRVA